MITLCVLQEFCFLLLLSSTLEDFVKFYLMLYVKTWYNSLPAEPETDAVGRGTSEGGHF